MNRNMINIFDRLSKQEVEDVLEKISNVKIAILGDICLDVHWRADMTLSEISRETPHFSLPIIEEWMTPGGGGNTAANIAALQPEKVYVIGTIGDDWRGEVLLKELEKCSIDTRGVIRSKTRVTNAYCKPLRVGISDVEYEDPRLDFENRAEISKEDEQNMLNQLDAISKDIDVLCVSDQLKYGCVSSAIREKIIELSKSGLTVVVDSRDRIGLYHDVILKPNEVEGYRALGNEGNPKGTSVEEFAGYALALSKKNNSDVCMTIGNKGSICIVDGMATHVKPNLVEPPIDICGAGDTFLASFSCAVGAGLTKVHAAALSSISTAISIKKINITGTADRQEISSFYEDEHCKDV